MAVDLAQREVATVACQVCLTPPLWLPQRQKCAARMQWKAWPPRRRKAEPSCPPIPIAEIRFCGRLLQCGHVGRWVSSSPLLAAVGRSAQSTVRGVRRHAGPRPVIVATLSKAHGRGGEAEEGVGGRGGVEAHRASPQSVPYVWAKAPRHFVQAWQYFGHASLSWCPC